MSLFRWWINEYYYYEFEKKMPTTQKKILFMDFESILDEGAESKNESFAKLTPIFKIMGTCTNYDFTPI